MIEHLGELEKVVSFKEWQPQRADLSWFERAQLAPEPDFAVQCKEARREPSAGKEYMKNGERFTTASPALVLTEAQQPFSPSTSPPQAVQSLPSTDTSLALPAHPPPRFVRGHGFFWTPRSRGGHQSTTLITGSILPSPFRDQSYPNASHVARH